MIHPAKPSRIKRSPITGLTARVNRIRCSRAIGIDARTTLDSRSARSRNMHKYHLEATIVEGKADRQKINLKIMEGEKILWQHIMVESSFPVVFEIEYSWTMDFMLFSAYLFPHEQQDFPIEIQVMPETPFAEEFCFDELYVSESYDPHYNINNKKDTNKKPLYLLSVAMNMRGDILKKHFNSAYLKNCKCTDDIYFYYSNEYQENTKSYGNNIVNLNNIVTSDTKKNIRAIQTAGYTFIESIYQQDCENYLVSIVGSGKIIYDNKLNLDFGTLGIEHGYLLIISIDYKGNVNWYGELGPIYLGSDGTPASSCLTDNGDLAIYFEYRYRPYYRLSTAELQRLELNIPIPLFSQHNLFSGFIVISKSGKLQYYTCLGGGYFCVDNLLYISDNILYMKGTASTVFPFQSENTCQNLFAKSGEISFLFYK